MAHSKYITNKIEFQKQREPYLSAEIEVTT